MKTILVTGANGFIGRCACAQLQGQGCSVRAAVRDRLSADGVTAQEMFEIHDVNGGTDWGRALQGVDVVVHLAGCAHRMRQRPDVMQGQYQRVDVDGTKRLAQEAVRAGVRRFVFVSTIQVLGNITEGVPFREGDPTQPQDAYARSKFEAESVLSEIAWESGMETVILRPPLVYGPGVKGNFLRLLCLVHTGLPLPFGRINNRRSFIGIRNLVDAIRLCLDHPAAAGRKFLLSDGEDISTTELLRRLTVESGHVSRLLPVPERIVSSFLRIAGGRKLVDRLTGSLQIDCSEIKRCLAWTPPVSLEEGLRETVAWYRGLVKGEAN